MQRAVIAGTDIQVSRIGFGTASLHHLYWKRERARLLSIAAGTGITHFDTAPYYGFGLAEDDLGAFLRGRRAGFTLTTKVGLYPRGSASAHASGVWARKVLGRVAPGFSLPLVNWTLARARASFEDSLARLRTDYVDFLMMHEPDLEVIRTDEFLYWFESEVTQGRVRHWGIAGAVERVCPFVSSNHPLAAVVQTRDSLDKREADFVLDAGRTLQFTYGYLSPRKQQGVAVEPERIIRAALQRNASGSVIVSTRRADRITDLATAAS